MQKEEIYISVDVETSGPIPGEYSMLSLGACLVDDVSKVFYKEFKPLNNNYIQESIKVSGLSLERLKDEGIEPRIGMLEFENWIKEVSEKNKPVFTAFNATFDWMFVSYYFHRFLGRNPFGVSGVDIKAYYMGKFNTKWNETSKRKIKNIIHSKRRHTHNALEDAIEQAEIFRKIQ